jgi:hypothetical protein
MSPSPVNPRFGDGHAPAPERADRTRIFVAQLMLKKPKVQFESSDNGLFRFDLPLAGSALSATDFANAKLVRTRWFADFVGEYVVRTNPEAVDEILCRPDYPDLTESGRHGGFGLFIGSDRLTFSFHAQLLSQLTNEALKSTLRGIAA